MIEYILYIVAFATGLGAAYLFFKTRLKKWASALTLLSTKQNNVGDPSRGNEAKTKLPSEFDGVVSSMLAPRAEAKPTTKTSPEPVTIDTSSKTQLNNMKIINELGQKVTSSLKLKETFEYLFSTLNSLMDAAVVELSVYDTAKDDWTIYSKIEEEDHSDYKNHMAEWVQSNNRAIVLDDAENDFGRYVKEPLQMQNGEMAKSMMSFPILLNDEVAGTITVVSFRKDAFDSYHQESIEHLLGFLSVALQNAITHEEVNLLKIRAEESEKHEQQFLANMSHEIRTPMNAVLGMTNLLLGTEVNDKQLKYLKAINISSKNLLVIINDILDLSKLEAGKMSIEKIPFRIRDVIHNVSANSRFKAEEKGLNFEVSIDPGLPEILKGDPTRLNQILTNLTSNAVKFTDKGKVLISVERSKNSDFVQFKVTDTGIGVPEDKLHLLFGNFKQVDASTYRKYGGTGLGLAISKTLIELQGGKVEVKSVLGQGSEFSVKIPYDIGTEADALSLHEVVKVDYANLSGIKILVAEDNEYNQIVVEDTLRSLIKNVAVDIAANGLIAVEMQEANTYDLILMDAQMPEMDGIEATKTIRKLKDATKNKIPIIALTASVHKADIDKCLIAGMNCFVPKPYTADQLLTAIAEFYHNTNPTTPEEETSDVVQTKSEEIVTPTLAATEIVSLGFLREFVEGDVDRMKKYVGLYLKLLPGNLEKIALALGAKDLVSLIKTIHSMRPHLSYMGMEEAAKMAAEMENFAHEGNRDSEVLDLAKTMVEHCEKSQVELEMLLPQIK
jgi:signal transduction histidine kinase/CheY-like chemotaxis protein/HPt (histidine-containing phosphotransfer) domain-containing protein